MSEPDVCPVCGKPDYVRSSVLDVARLTSAAQDAMDELGRSRCITRAAIADRAGVAIEKLYVNEMTPQERDRVLWVLGELGVRIDPKRPADYTDAELRAIAGPDCPDFGAMSDLELKRSLSRSRHPLSRALSWFLGTAVVSRCRGLRRRGS